MRPSYRIDGRDVAAAEFYAAACDPTVSVAVEACAGAGKTWMLVSRILRVLIDGADPSEILAITFTRKAAGEMRQRLDEWLRMYAAPNCDDVARVEALQARGLDLARARSLAPALGELQARVLAAPRPVDIRTFHGWFAQLLAQAPLAQLDAMGLAPGLALIEDPEPLHDELMSAFHRAVQADPARREDYVDLVRRHRRHTVQSWLDAAWHRRTEVEAADAAGCLDTSVAPAWQVFDDVPSRTHPLEAMRDAAWRDELRALAAALGARDKKLSTQAAGRLVDALGCDDPARAFALVRLALLTADGAPRKQLGDLPGQQPATDRVLALSERLAQQEAHEDHLRMVRLSRLLLSEYAALKRRRGLADMGDLEAVARAVLVDGELAGWVQTRLDRRLRHLLVDEFQDTSPLQWQALHGWLSGYAGAGGGPGLSVFIVGDPKQSIYRFRRAEPRVFAAAGDFVANGLQGRRLACDHTRRNGAAVIAALNRVFDDAGRVDGWAGFRPHTTGAEGAGRVRRLPVADARKPARAGAADDRWRDSLTEPRHAEETLRHEPEAREVAAGIAELVGGGVAPSRIMVLSRRRATLSQVAAALSARHLPFTMPEDLSLSSSTEAQDLVAIVDVLASPGHALSLARALRSPIFGASDDDLLTLASAAVEPADWWAVLMAGGAAIERSAALHRARDLLAGWAAAASTLPPHDLLDRIVHEGDVHARVAAALPPRLRRGAAQAIDALLAAALELGGGRYSTPYRFVRAIRRDEVRARLPAPEDAVKLLTVHGAKGLEAEWVFVIDTDPQARAAERATLLVDWAPAQAAPSVVAFVAREGAIAPSLRALLDEEQAARGREEINGLYVAMTRAIEGLVFSATAPAREDPRSWWRRVMALAEPWQPVAADPARAAAPAAAVPTLPTRRARAPVPTVPVADDPRAARLGQAVHRLLEWIGRPDRPLARAEWPAAARAAARAFGVPALAEQVLDLAGAVRDSPDCSRFFGGPALVWAGNELPIADRGETLRLDRLVRLEDGGDAGWWVLDYKLGDQPDRWPAYRAQLARYVDAVRAANPGERVVGAFITGRGRLVPLAGAPGAM